MGKKSLTKKQFEYFMYIICSGMLMMVQDVWVCLYITQATGIRGPLTVSSGFLFHYGGETLRRSGRYRGCVRRCDMSLYRAVRSGPAELAKALVCVGAILTGEKKKAVDLSRLIYISDLIRLGFLGFVFVEHENGS